MGYVFLTEKYDDKYIEDKYGVKDDNVVMIKNGGVEEGNNEDILLWRDMRSYIINHDMSDDLSYGKACELIDIDSYIFYYATEIYLQNEDWPYNNYALWRTRDVGNGLFQDGKWRWLLFDVNAAFMSNSKNTYGDTIKWATHEDAMFKSLMRNRIFREKFANALSEVGKECFKKDKMSNLIDKYEEEYINALEANFDRYFGKEKDSRIHDELNRRKQFFNTRYDKIMGYMNYYLENPDALLNKYAVSFESNGGSSVAKIYTDGGIISNAPQNPSREGYEFEGWFKESGCKTRWDFSRDTVNSNLILYAGWKQIPDNTLKEPEEDPKSPVDVPEIPNAETRVPLLKNSTYASSADNFAPVLKASNIKNLALDFTNVDQSSIDGNSLMTTVIQGSVLKTVDEVASVVSTEKKLKVKLNKKTGIATVIANKSGSVVFNMKNGKTYTISFVVEKPKAVKKAKKMKVEPGKTVSLSAQDLFGTSIDAGSLRILSHKIKNNSEIKENKLFIKPECKDRIRAEYSYLNKKYRITINVK